MMTRTPLAASIASLAIGSIVTQPSQGWAQALSGGGTEATANRELARRMQRGVTGREATEAGQTALRKKDYEAAFAHYKNACESIPAGAPAVAQSRKVAVDGFTTAGIKLAEQRVSEGYYASAVQALQEVLKHNPDSKPVLNLLSNIEAPDYFNKQMTPQHRANVEEVKKAFVAAQGYKDLGRLGLAERKYEEVLNKDPYNVAAHKGREEVALLKDRAAVAGYDAARAIAIWEVDNAWARPFRRFDRKAVTITSADKTSAPNTVEINKKLNTIIFPKIDFQNSTVREAIQFLVDKSRTLDPENKGVNIVLKLGDEGGGGGGAPAPAPGIPGIPGLPDVPGAPAPAGGAPAGGGGGTQITLTLANVPLIEVIKYITNLANLKYKIEPFAVSIVPLGTSTEELYIKEWKVPPSLLRATPGGGAGAAGGGLGAPPADGGLAAGGGLAGTSNAKDFLSASGVTFGQNAFAMYSPASSTLVVKNTQDQLDLVERIIEIQGVEGVIKQVEIQAKFVEITQTNLKELSFDWLLGPSNIPRNLNVFTGGGTSGTAPQTGAADFPFFNVNPADTPVTAGNRSGRLALSANAIDALLFGVPGASQLAPGIFSLVGAGTDPTFQLVMRGLDQKKGVDLLSAPRVTTKSGQRATIEIIREFKYPTEFSPPQIPQQFGGNVGGIGIGAGGGTTNGSFPVTPTTPTAFEKKDVGVTLEVEPTIGPDGYSIDMQLLPQVVEFEGFINYGSPIQTTNTNPITGQVVTNILTPNIINQPVFSTRKVSTNVTVFDGATVVLGGLVREDVQKVDDKTPIIGDIPLVGRLFRSKVDQHSKRNLVIFVTARLVNPEGAPILSDEEKEEPVEQLPMPEIATPLPSVPSDGKSFRPIQTSMPAWPNERIQGTSGGALNPAARRSYR
ncbi:MAG: Amuc_1098 family type IV pilus outer membrane protein [Chthoniobacteraceae bacterium]